VKLVMLRHAKVQLAPGVCYGSSDLPADAALTWAAAHAAAAVIAPGASIRVSALQRAQQLAHALGQLRPDLAQPTVDARLNEKDFGCWELQPWHSIPQAAIDEWVADFAGFPFGGRDSTQAVVARVADALRATFASLDGDGEAVWITHAGPIRAVQFLVQHGPARVPRSSDWLMAAPDPGGSLTLVVEPAQAGWLNS
jgi:alpha-ribazole phosphatase